MAVKWGQVFICASGCCCGRVDKGAAPIPLEWLQKSWKEFSLHKSLQLSTTGCMGPCDKKNVIGIITKEEQLWLGSITENDHYAALLEWFKASAAAGHLLELPSLFNDHSFERFTI
jgi:predicted metal-binding protein